MAGGMRRINRATVGIGGVRIRGTRSPGERRRRCGTGGVVSDVFVHGEMEVEVEAKVGHRRGS